MQRKPTNHKKLIIMILAWIVVIISIIVGAAMYKQYQGNQYAETAVPFLEKAITALSTWEPEKARTVMAPEAMEYLTDESFAAILSQFSRLGSLKSIGEPQFKSLLKDTSGSADAKTIVSYKVSATYTNGKALLAIQLYDKGDRFEVSNFTLSSELLGQ